MKKETKTDEGEQGSVYPAIRNSQPPHGSNLSAVMQSMNFRFGAGTVSRGTEMALDPPRLPFGVFAVDHNTGGGMPMWGSTCLWGGDKGGKTSLALNAVAMTSRVCWRCFNLLSSCSCSGPPLCMKSFYSDVEGTLDREWAESIGADSESYFYSLADYGEMYINIAEAALRADDCGLLVMDSLAALVPSVEFDAAAEDQFIGKQAAMIGRCVRRLKQRMIRERKRGHPCCILFLNQLRSKIGQLFGSNETMSGGWQMRHEFSLLIRVVQKAFTESDKKKFSGKDRDFAIRHATSIKATKVATLARSGEYVRILDDLPEMSLSKGTVDDFAVLLAYALRFGIVRKGDSGKLVSTVGGEKKIFTNKSDIIQQWKEDRDAYLGVSKAVVDAAKLNLRCGEENAYVVGGSDSNEES